MATLKTFRWGPFPLLGLLTQLWQCSPSTNWYHSWGLLGAASTPHFPGDPAFTSLPTAFANCTKVELMLLRSSAENVSLFAEIISNSRGTHLTFIKICN